MANRYFTATTCNDSTSITFITDDLIITANPINRIYQVNDGRCITISSSGVTTTEPSACLANFPVSMQISLPSFSLIIFWITFVKLLLSQRLVREEIR
jgi:hypothetical protein